MSTIHIRPATYDDAAAISRVHIDSWLSSYGGIIDQDYLDKRNTPDYRASKVKKWQDILLQGDDMHFVACDDENII